MIRLLSGFLAGGLILGTGAMTHAGSHTWREARHQARVSQGVRSGEITPCELKHLEREQASIEALRQRAWSDGRLNPWEVRHLTWEQNRASRHTWRVKHNAYHAW
jgi:hypothetical protein